MERAFIKIHGIVQGVGFRPFVHKAVREKNLRGSIRNTSSGVELELEGEEGAIHAFVEELPHAAPPLAYIEKIEAEYGLEPAGLEGFCILPSLTENARRTLISPDVSICPDCLRELRDPTDRRFRFPFINCTNCGPRFTIIRDLPYDRPKTSMGAFPMCPDCAAEYGDIEDRRYHAQPDCCPVCGPSVFYLDASGAPVEGDAFELARAALKNGGIIAVKGLGGMHLACRCDSPELLRELRRRKRRDEKPFAVMCRDAAAAEKLCRVSAEERRILESPRRPIVLLDKLVPGSYPGLSENGAIGVMLPYTPLHYILLGEDIDMLVMTSANISDTPIMFSNDEALSELAGVADGFLLHNRDIVTRCDDSLCRVLDGKEYFFRRSRGYVPYPVSLGRDFHPVLACGAEQKASFCLSEGHFAFLSQHIGDLKNAETLSHYEAQIGHFEKLFDINPAILACDLHPDYLSTEYARALSEDKGLPLIQVQHHHAHMASCMADNNLDGECLGLVWDGTGLGADGTVWGSELLAGGFGGFSRFGSIRPIALPGGDRAVKETDRVAVSLLKTSGCDYSRFSKGGSIASLMDSGMGCPLSSGMGRLFDGVSAILGIKTLCSYEGQGAILLEAAAAEDSGEYPFSFYDDGGVCRLDWIPLVRALNAEYESGESVSLIAARFMNTLISAAAEQCARAAASTGLERVVLSGGSFQNMYIMRRLPAALRERGLEPFHHVRVSPNDEGISLGQLAIAGTLVKNGEY